jgi:hypothetical protein
MFDATALEGRLRARGWFFEPHSEVRDTRIIRRWHLRDLLNRGLYHLYGPNGEPAVVVLDWTTQVKVREEWRLNCLHREMGPALIIRDRMTGGVMEEAWYSRGRRHRIDGPALVRFDAASGSQIFEGFWRNGREILGKAVAGRDDLVNRPESVTSNRLKRSRAPASSL